MFTVRVKERGGEEQQLSFDKVEVSIGRGKGNDVVLAKGNVSKRHARIVHRDDKFFVVDLRSTNGTYFNARKISSPVIVSPDDKVIIGDFVLRIEGDERPAVEEGSFPPPPPAAAVQEDEITLSASVDDDVPPPVMGLDEALDEPPMTLPEPPVEPLSFGDTPTLAFPSREMDLSLPEPPSGDEETAELSLSDEPDAEPTNDIPSEALLAPMVEEDEGEQEALDLAPEPAPEPAPAPSRTSTAPDLRARGHEGEPAVAKLAWKAAALVAGDPELAEALASGDRTTLVDAYTRLVEEALEEGTLPATTTPREVADALAERGLLELLLASDEVLEVTAAGHDRVFVSSGVARQAWAPGFPEPRVFDAEVHRILARLGVDTAKPPAYAEGLIAPDCRARVVLPPLSDGPICQLSTGPEQPQTLDTLIWAGAIEETEAETLRCAVSSGRSVAIVGPPSSGRVALLNALCEAVSDSSLIATGEHRPGLRVNKPGALHFQLQEDPARATQMLSRVERFGAELLVVDHVCDQLLPGFVLAAIEAAPQSFLTVTGRDLARFLRRAVAVLSRPEGAGSVAAATEVVAEVFDLLVLMERSAGGGYRVKQIGRVVQAEDGSLDVGTVD